jgi:uncharacterized repeat protein (TIGR01451 family)
MMMRHHFKCLGLAVTALVLAVAVNSARGGIVVDNASSAIGNTDSLSWTHVVNAGSNRILMVGTSHRDGNKSVTSITYAGMPLTRAGFQNSPGNSNRTSIWFLINPPVGSANVIITLTDVVNIAAGACSFTGVNQITPMGPFSSTNGSSLSSSLTTASAPGEVVFDTVVCDGDGVSTATAGAGQTEQWNRQTGIAGGDIIGGASTSLGAASVTTTWTFDVSKPWATGSVSLKPGLPQISGNVFEDVNYGGGAGRSKIASSGVGSSAARVELYDASGNFIAATNTDASGNYAFLNLSAANYTVRVVNASVSSSRPGSVAGLISVQTFRTDTSSGTATAVTNRVGGEDPTATDAGNGGPGTIMDPATGLFTAGITGQAQSIAPVTVNGIDIGGIDFGYNFDTIVNVNDAGQGSLRQFIINSNALTNAGLVQSGQVAGREVSIFMITDGAAHPGLRPGLANLLTGGVAVIVPTSALLPPVTDANTTIDGTNQNANVGDTNPGSLGAGGLVGVNQLALSTVNRPEVQLNDSGTHLARGLDLQANNVIIRGLSVYGFGATGNSDTSANILVGASASNVLIEQNVIGTGAVSFADPGAATRSGGDNIRVVGGANATIQNNVIGFSAGNGVALSTNATGAQILSNEIRGNGLTNSASGGVNVGAGSAATIQTNLIAANNGAGVDVASGAGANTIVNNTVTGNGTGAGSVTSGIRLLGSSNTIDRNIITTNTGAGVMVGSTGATNTITKNSIFANTGIGIDLLSAGDNQTTGTAPFVTLNDMGDADAGGNGLLNFPVFSTASIFNGNLVLKGFARPGSVIELFVADPDPSNFGEGKTYLMTLTEGSGSDTDNGTGSYTNPVNGLNQGTDNTNRFTFTVPVPPGVVIGSVLTATATLGNATSEFSGNATVTDARPDVSGFVYNDANLNLQRDSSETGTGLTLYVKLVNTTNPSGPALAAATVDPVTGAYILPNVPTGTYTLILDDNNTLADVTPTIPAGWTSTEMSGGVRSPVAVNTTGVPNQNFGLYHGLLITGRVFDDNGAGGGVANDGTLNGGEMGIAAVTVQLTDLTGATIYATATTSSSGGYALALPSTIAAGTQLKIVETNPASYLSTGANVGNTSGSYTRASDTITFTVAANTSYTNVNFGDVPPNTLTTDGQQAGLPGTTLFYAHTFTAASAGTVLFSTASTQTPALAGWTATLYRDLNSNGQLDANETAITGAITVNANDVISVIIKEFIPTNASFGAKDQTTLTALFTYTGAAPSLTSTLTRQDVTTVGNPTTAGLTLTKNVDKPSAAPGETITYTISYANNSSDVLRNVVIYDNTPAFTKFVSGGNGPLPLDLTGVVLTAPSPGQRGAMKWTFAGTLRPGGTGTVTYQVTLDQ